MREKCFLIWEKKFQYISDIFKKVENVKSKKKKPEGAFVKVSLAAYYQCCTHSSRLKQTKLRMWWAWVDNWSSWNYQWICVGLSPENPLCSGSSARNRRCKNYSEMG